MGHLFEELKRRNVVRVAIAYAVVGWLIIEVIDTIAPRMAMPEWVPGFFIIAVLVGFPLALFFSWAYELTPQGVKKTHEVDADDSITPSTGRKLDFIIIAALVVALGYFVWDKFGADLPGGEVATSAKASIAVLPFVNMSNDPDQEFFSDGISEEILNALAKIPGLQVTSRSSAFQFKGENIDIPTVARQLGVTNVLEGSVRKAGTRIRITAQLIDAESDKHIWSETYDRELTDVFAIQDEISAAIVAQLRRHLGGGLESEIEITPAPMVAKVTQTLSPAAYEQFLLARHLIARRNKTTLESAIESFERVLAEEPDYAPAWSGIGEATLLLENNPCCYGDLSREEVIARAEPALRKALEIDPDLADAWAAMGLLLENKGERDAGLEAINRAIEINPNMARAYTWKKSLTRDIRARFEAGKRALELDPLSLVVNVNYSRDLALRSRFDEARTVLQKIESLFPDRAAVIDAEIYGLEGKRGNSAFTYLKALEHRPDDPRARFFYGFLMLELGLPEVAELLLIGNNVARFPRWAAGDEEGALAVTLKGFLADPDRASRAAGYALALYRSGEIEGARKQFERVFELDPEWVRSFFGFGDGLRLAHLRRLAGDEKGAADLLGQARVQIDRLMEAGIDEYDRHAEHAWLLALEGRTDAAFATSEMALARGWLPPPHTRFFIGDAFRNDPRFPALLTQIEERRAAAQKDVAGALCGPDVELPASEIRTATCDALAGG